MRLEFRHSAITVSLGLSLAILAACSLDTGMVQSTDRASYPDLTGWSESDDVFFEKNNTFFFRGEVIGAHDLALGKRQAEADAKKRIVEKVRSDALVEFRELARGANVAPHDVGRFAEDMIESVSKVSISGITPVKSRWEEVAVPSSPDRDSSRAYHIYSLVAIPKSEFDRAKSDLIGSALKKTANSTKEVEALLEEWKRKRQQEE